MYYDQAGFNLAMQGQFKHLKISKCNAPYKLQEPIPFDDDGCGDIMNTRTCLNITKTTDSKCIANIKLIGEKFKVIVVKSETRQSCPLYPNLFTIELEGLVSVVRQLKQIMGIQIGKEEDKVSLLIHDMIVYRNDPKSSTRELLQSKNTFNKVAGYKII